MKIVNQLRDLKDKGSLSLVDMARWFNSSGPTMRGWLFGLFEPMPSKVNLLSKGSKDLGRAIKLGFFPVPMEVTQFQRAEYIKEVRNAVTKGVSKSDFTSRWAALLDKHRQKERTVKNKTGVRSNKRGVTCKAN